MSNEEVLIEPVIFFGPGECPICSGPICVADSEISLMELDRNGNPITEETIIKVKGICMHCGNKRDMARWEGGYVPYNPVTMALRMEKRRLEAETRVMQLNENAKGKNPFAV